MRGDLGERLDESHDGVRFHAVEDPHARAREQRPAERLELDIRQPAPQGSRDGRGVRISRRLACRDVDPCHGRAAASGEALMASATR